MTSSRRLANLARGQMRHKHAALVEALTGQFDEHHAELAQMLLDQIDALTGQIDQLTDRAGQLLEAIPEAQAPTGDDGEDPNADTGGHNQHIPRPRLTAWQRLDEITGIGVLDAQVILAEIGLDMTRFPTAGHLVSWARLCPRTIQSGPKQRSGKTGKGNSYLNGTLGVAAATAARSHTFLGERYRRVVKRRGKGKALVAVARSILVVIWHLLADPNTRFHDLGADYHANWLDTRKKARNHIRQLEALGFTVTLNQAA